MKRSPLLRKTPLRAHTRIRPHARHRSTRVEDKAYLAWVHTQPSIVQSPVQYVGSMGLAGCQIEAHHHVPGDDRSAVPLLRWLHRETQWSVHAGGGRKKFEQRWGISFEAEIARLNAKYEFEKGEAA